VAAIASVVSGGQVPVNPANASRLPVIAVALLVSPFHMLMVEIGGVDTTFPRNGGVGGVGGSATATILAICYYFY
jgi:hypothetical protein